MSHFACDVLSLTLLNQPLVQSVTALPSCRPSMPVPLSHVQQSKCASVLMLQVLLEHNFACKIRDRHGSSASAARVVKAKQQERIK